jgi:hypothetical protein
MLALRDLFGGDIGLCVGDACTRCKRIAQQQSQQNRPHGPVSSVHPMTFWRLSRESGQRRDLTPFRVGAPGRHKPKMQTIIPGTKLRSLKAGPSCPDL